MDGVVCPSVSRLFLLILYSRAFKACTWCFIAGIPSSLYSQLFLLVVPSYFPSLEDPISSPPNTTPPPKSKSNQIKNISNSHQQPHSSIAASSSHGTDNTCKSSSQADS
jgi:hypothetical protein